MPHAKLHALRIAFGTCQMLPAFTISASFGPVMNQSVPAALCCTAFIAKYEACSSVLLSENMLSLVHDGELSYRSRLPNHILTIIQSGAYNSHVGNIVAADS